MNMKHNNRKPKNSQQQKGENRSTRRARLGQESEAFDEKAKHYVAPSVTPKNDFQKNVMEAIKTKQVVVILAPAGNGKSFLVMSHFSDKLKKKEIDKVIITRPNVHMGKSIGSLPGAIEDKMAPLVAPLTEVITGFYQSNRNNDNIEILPVEFARGRNFRDVAIIDESQGLTPDEAYTFLTRVCDGGQLIFLGDPTQKDSNGKDGLTWLKEFVARHPHLEEFIEVIEGESGDIVRGGLCKAVVQGKESDVATGTK